MAEDLQQERSGESSVDYASMMQEAQAEVDNSYEAAQQRLDQLQEDLQQAQAVAQELSNRLISGDESTSRTMVDDANDAVDSARRKLTSSDADSDRLILLKGREAHEQRQREDKLVA